MGSWSAGAAAPTILSAMDTLELYDPYSGRYTPVCDAALIEAGFCDPRDCAQAEACLLRLSEPRGFHAAVRLDNGDVMIIGGLTSEGGEHAATNAVDVIHPTGDGVSASIRSLDSSTTALIDERAFATATRLPDGSVVVVGGMSGTLDDPTFPTRVEVAPADGRIFRAATENDVEIAILPRAMHTATPVGDRVLIVGGRTAEAVVSASELLVLDGGQLFMDPPPTENLMVPRFGTHGERDPVCPMRVTRSATPR